MWQVISQDFGTTTEHVEAVLGNEGFYKYLAVNRV